MIIISAIALVMLIVLFFAFYTAGFRLQSPVVFLSPSEHSFTHSSAQPIQGIESNVPFATLQEVSEGGATEKMSYQQAVQFYKNAHLTFNPNCRVSPVTLVVPVKSVVMLDNQSKWQRSIIVGPRTYVIEPYDYVLAEFNVPGPYGISCDSVQNVGIVNVQ